MKVLVACEYSGRVRDAFIAKGHDAISCDLLPTDADGPHHQGDVYDMLDQQWDLIIAHPPCTALTVAGNSTYGEGQQKYSERLASVQWTVALWAACKTVSPRVCFENPVGVLPRLGGMPKPHYVQPYQFGHMEQKKTGLFLHGLPPLTPTNNVYEGMMKLPKNVRERLHYLPPSPDRWKIRSTTYQGIADAMASQWASAPTTPRTKPMNLKDIPAELTTIHQMIVDRFNAQPFLEASLTCRQSGAWFIHLYRDINGGKYDIATARGDTPADAIADAKRIIAALPDENTQKKRDWQKKLSNVIDEGHDLSLPDDVLAPLRAGSQAMTENLLTSEVTQ